MQNEWTSNIDIKATGSLTKSKNNCRFCGNDCEITISPDDNGFDVCRACAKDLVTTLSIELSKLDSIESEIMSMPTLSNLDNGIDALQF